MVRFSDMKPGNICVLTDTIQLDGLIGERGELMIALGTHGSQEIRTVFFPAKNFWFIPQVVLSQEQKLELLPPRTLVLVNLSCAKDLFHLRYRFWFNTNFDVSSHNFAANPKTPRYLVSR